LHILFLNSWYPSRVLPTNGDFIQRHAETTALQHQVTSIHVITDTDIEKNELSDRIINGIRTLIYYLKPKGSEMRKQIVFFKKYLELIDLAGPFDLIHVNRIYPAGIVALYLKRKKNIPYIITEHFTGYLSQRSKQLSKTELFFDRHIVKNAAFICPVTTDLKKNMQDLGLHGNYHVIPNIVDTNIFKPRKKEHRSFTITHISSLVNDHKNISGILKTISKIQQEIPDLLFNLIGDDPSRYKKEISNLKIDPENIKLIDQIPHREVASILQSTDLLLMFSNYENLPCVILEAFACGVPVISTDVGGIKEYFPENFGNLISPGDENALFDSILNLYNKKDHPGKETMHQYAEKEFGKESILSKYNKLYYEILN
jgi:glycosyltransferase involved in cell wall biosynthesis